jgi:uncharacterized protein (TIGR02145 family)
MRTQLTKITLTAGIALAIAFTLSCSSSDDDPVLPPVIPDSSNSGDSSSSGGSSSSLGEISSSSFDICGGFIDGTAKVHYGKSKQQFCDRRDGQKYVYVTTGTGATAQTWMAENLNFNADGSLCYDDDTGGDSEGNCAEYGRLYDWATAMDDVCPSGWHLPNGAEWQTLMDFAGGDAIAGTKLKATSGWNSADSDYIPGTDDYGFSALPGGGGGGSGSNGSFYDVGDYGNWWSSSESDYDSDRAYLLDMGYDYESADYYNRIKSYLYSVRCLKD